MHFPPLLRAARRLAASRPEARRFAVRAWLAAPLVRASLALVGLRSTLRWIETVGPARPQAPAREAIGVTEASDLVRGAFRAHPVGGECLPQSLVQYLLHRRDGLSVRLVVGVRRAGRDGDPLRPAPIDAHAWIEDTSGTFTPAPPAPETQAFAPLFVTGPSRDGKHSRRPERTRVEGCSA